MKELTTAIHPKTGESYSVGDRIDIYQGRLGHHNIWIIGSIWEEGNGEVYVTPLKEAKQITHISAIHRKISDKELASIAFNQRTAQAALKYQIK